MCCDKKIIDKREIQRHIAINHNQDVSRIAAELRNNDESCSELKRRYNKRRRLDSKFEDIKEDNEENCDGQDWMPKNVLDLIETLAIPEVFKNGAILLFYKYR